MSKKVRRHLKLMKGALMDVVILAAVLTPGIIGMMIGTTLSAIGGIVASALMCCYVIRLLEL